ncbi:hypothetical protein HKX54_02460 [Sulfitobacter sp. M57]|uniref:hypothetical protein n=1 Tax=unclassified Sulfitobacter TaxID=196795 RepID=UPI0023E216BE|nr:MULTISPECIES: hypothetical protein [unclassified Sulfitobacter]MDF3413306.1 hypothetical protein [Sulfitobacter sp. KE5]MDF3421414.1 hypothetical protein [Sulfitobacter sp. KE43]MDF3431853.1 hypothetical protein [Sulfitobacter sp. KE42]MDF3457493.1 hypothetical protein [Sulfitobacter sp. S74]MDF3461395.1 hypothetical protein [Sulfitobacter sp. Ks18]
MSVLFDHETFDKTRRAVIITATVVMALHFVELCSDHIDVFSLKIAVSKLALELAGRVTLFYLIVVFFLQAVRFRISGLWDELSKIDPEDEFVKLGEFEQHVRSSLDEYIERRFSKYRELNSWLAFSLNFGLPFGIGVFALLGFHSDVHILFGGPIEQNLCSGIPHQ